MQRFIEGKTLGELLGAGCAVPPDILGQIIGMFRQMVEVPPESLSADRCCISEHLRKHVSGLKERPFSLLHADLHRENLIVDDDRRLWTIDWELAVIGDPLYDVATHLHLMRYPDGQARAVARQWADTVERVRPGSANGWRHDLPLLLGYKRAQSLITDVVRVAQSLGACPERHWWLFAKAALKLRRVLTEAALWLGLESVPGSRQIATALVRWQHDHGRSPGYVPA
ncbi:phosphotransferase family protein [Streptomyces sp. NPDC001480]|uniref:phosphotransferase family protein n=1 Tax=Streptomyces sp. NPDC001480 TaxID=3364577 RepID=UPI0036C7AD12